MECFARVTSDKAVFPLSTIDKVIVSNTDSSSYQTCQATKGRFTVDFDLTVTEEEGYVTDHIKFHFFTPDTVPVLITAGAVDLKELKGGEEAKFKFTCNFQKVDVELRISCQPFDCTCLTPSVLQHTVPMTNLTLDYVDKVEKLVKRRLDVDEKNGGPMFCKLLAIHNMSNQATSHLHYQYDFQPSQYTSDRFLLSGITMSCLIETLWLQHQSVADIMQLEDSDMRFTRFIVMVTQACMRSAYLCPYTADMNVAPYLRNGKHALVDGESFKRPFGEPFSGTDALHSMQNDDCEGEAVFIYWLFSSFAYLEAHPRDAYFPEHLFQLSETERMSVFALALRIGQLIKEQKLACDITVVSAGAPSLDEGGSGDAEHLTGHATCVITNSAADPPHTVVTEGTNCMCPDVQKQTITIERGGETKDVSISNIANMLTRKMMRGEKSDANRVMMHIDFSGIIPFYRYAFLQNDSMLASKKDDDKLSYGVNFRDMNNHELKTFVPVDKKVMPNADKTLRAFYDKRRDEIHTPLAPVAKILQATKHWSPLSLYEKQPELQGRKFIVCMYSTSCTDPQQRVTILEQKREEAARWNETHPDIGFSTAFAAFDSVYHVLCLYTDNMEALKNMIRS